MKYLFIANPIAGKGKTKKLLNDIKSYLNKKNINFYLVETTKPGDVEKIVSENRNDFDRIIVIGGDGTLHELINSEKIKDKILGVLPTGSGNDFALALGFKKNLFKDLDTLLKHKTLSIDIGYAEVTEFSGRRFNFLFANSLGIGFDAEVASSVLKVKFFRGIILYLIGVFLTLIKYRYRVISIKSDSMELREPIFMVSIGNGKTAGGGFKLTPLATPVDGLLDICVVKRISKLKVLRILPLAIFGKHIKNKSVVYFKSKEINITSDKPVHIHADGEIRTNNMKSIKILLFNRYANFISDGVVYVNEKA